MSDSDGGVGDDGGCGRDACDAHIYGCLIVGSADCEEWVDIHDSHDCNVN